MKQPPGDTNLHISNQSFKSTHQELCLSSTQINLEFDSKPVLSVWKTALGNEREQKKGQKNNFAFLTGRHILFETSLKISFKLILSAIFKIPKEIT